MITMSLIIINFVYFPVRTFTDVAADIRFSELDITFFYLLQYTIPNWKLHAVEKYFSLSVALQSKSGLDRLF